MYVSNAMELIRDKVCAVGAQRVSTLGALIDDNIAALRPVHAHHEWSINNFTSSALVLY